jgi:hypothetical protein
MRFDHVKKCEKMRKKMRFENAIGKNVKNAFQKCENVKKM